MCQCEGAIAVTKFRPPLLFILGQFIAKRANLNIILAPAQQWFKIMTLLWDVRVRKGGRQSQTLSFHFHNVMCSLLSVHLSLPTSAPHPFASACARFDNFQIRSEEFLLSALLLCAPGPSATSWKQCHNVMGGVVYWNEVWRTMWMWSQSPPSRNFCTGTPTALSI